MGFNSGFKGLKMYYVMWRHAFWKSEGNWVTSEKKI